MLRCNCCWVELPQTAILSVSCSHIFCEEDAKNHFSRSDSCPVCDTPITNKSNLTKINLAATTDKLLSLCGLSPRKISEISTKALEFWDYQRFTELQFVQHQSKHIRQKLQTVEKGLNDRQSEYQNKITMLTHKLQSIESERSLEKKELEDLQHKYAEQSRQKRRLSELYESLKQKHSQTTSPVSSFQMEHTVQSQGSRSLAPSIPSPSPPQIPSIPQTSSTPFRTSLSIRSDSSSSSRFDFRKSLSQHHSIHSPKLYSPVSSIDRFALVRRSPNVSDTMQSPPPPSSSSTSSSSRDPEGSSRPVMSVGRSAIASLFQAPKRPSTPSFSFGI